MCRTMLSNLGLKFEDRLVRELGQDAGTNRWIFSRMKFDIKEMQLWLHPRHIFFSFLL